MPTYQYACTACGERLEVVQKFTDDPLAECPSCAGRLRKLFSAVGIVFKGSGFYRTDSRSGGSVGTSTTTTPATASSESTTAGAKSSESSTTSSESVSKPKAESTTAKPEKVA
ncbi:FmdB family zinc ribbon protein [Rhizohabitans arisaemae]|uniref:FmdB family zinc ribbon protein n=1 Tax=Rhizohabitans arisaemae TaxID=2720610 RepID=UPI0024B157B5|nr:FmdB family zinc ribbon protein [Rhizohabitans arisaemae]